MKDYKYDVAISLCKQDVDFARKLVKQLNPSLKVFFYEDNQEELISKSGPEAFGSIFKEETRVIVILSRKEWSDSFYSDIERNAIIDRTSVKNEGYNFLLVIPMEPHKIPSWYPSTRIYANPLRFDYEQLAKFIEFKVTEEGGKILPLTIETRYQSLLNRIEEKKLIIKLQTTQEAILAAKEEVKIFKDCVNIKIELLRSSIFRATSWHNFNEHGQEAYLEVGSFSLECNIVIQDEMYHPIVSTQEFSVLFKLVEISGSEKKKKILEEEQRFFHYTPQIKSWALIQFYEQTSDTDQLVLFPNKDRTRFYDLIQPLTTEQLVDVWFQRLLTKASASIERYL